MAKKGLQTLPHLTDDVARLVEDFSRETDRGVALLGAAFLDDALDLMLRAALVDDADAVNRLIGPGRPLETFGARTHLAYCMGLIGPDLYADINLIREIRNDFAHRQPTQFDQAELRPKCRRFQCIAALEPGEDCTPRELYIASVVLIVNHLLISTASLSHAQPGKSFAENGVLRLR